MGDTLSQEEIDNLLKAFNDGDLNADDFSDTKEKQVKNIYFNLNNDKDIRLLLEAGACFYRRINGKYTSYDPLKIKSYQIEQEYFRNKDK